MLRQRTLKDYDSHDRRRSAHRRARRIDAAPGTRRHRHRVPSRRPADAGRRSRRRPINVGDTRLSSTLALDGTSISTVEHLMSALAGVGVDNLHVDVAGPELPIMDGSAGPFVFLLQSAGIVEQAAPKRYLRVRAPVEMRDGDKWARFDPFRRLQARLHDRFPAPGVRHGEPARRRRLRRAFVREGSRARAHVRLHAGRRGDALGGARARRQPAERDRARRDARAEHRGPALRQRVRQAQGAGRDRRPVPARAVR